MRNPISDANEGAAMDVAPTKTHAVRAATVAQTGNNNTLQRIAQTNQIASTLASSIGNFAAGKRQTELEQRYTKAFHEQGLKTGLAEYQKDLKNTGFTEFIYGGQTPEYSGALNAASRNASNAMMLEEQEFVESTEGMSMTPEAYQQRIQKKITQYNAENFSDAPDAAFGFMKNWKDNSNELSRQQYKNNQVYQQQEARRTVAEGFQTDLDVYKNTIKSNPDRAAELGDKMYSMLNKPLGMSETAYRGVIVDEGLTAIEAHDYAALKLMNDSGITKSFNSKELKRYDRARAIIDTDNFNLSEAARLDYETVVENKASSSQEVANARTAYNSSITQLDARDTGTTKHLKTTFGADRWRGVIGNQYQAKLEAEAAERVADRVDFVGAVSQDFEVNMLSAANPSKRRSMVADRLDALALARLDPDLDPEVREEISDEFITLRRKLDTWTSELEARKLKEDKVLLKREQEERETKLGVESLVTGGGYISASVEAQKVHIKGAVDFVMNQVIPDTGMSSIDKIEKVFSNPVTASKALRASGNFSGYLTDSPEIKTAIRNLSSNLHANMSGVENNEFTTGQIENMKSLEVVIQKAPQLYNKAFNEDERVVNSALMDAMKLKKGPKETLRLLNQVEQRRGTLYAGNLKPEDLADLTVGNAPRDVQDSVYTEYKNHLVLGEDRAIQAAREFAQGFNTKVGNNTIRYGSTFQPVLGRNLEDTMKILESTYVSGKVYKTGMSHVMSRLVGSSKDSTGRELSKLDQVPNVSISVLEGNLMFELNGRTAILSRSEIESEINGYNEWRNR